MKRRLSVLFCAGLLAAPAAAHAQVIGQTLLDSEIPDAQRYGRNVAVFDRPHPEYDALGVRLGGFVAYPSLSVGPGYDGNVFGAPAHKTQDVYYGISPSLYVTSDWGRHQVSASVGADLREYQTQSTEDEGAWHVKIDGRLDILDVDSLTGGFEARKLYNERNSGFYPIGAAAPVGYTKTGGYLRYSRENGRIRAVASVDSFDYRYDAVAALGGGVIDQSFNDQRTTRLSARLEYALTPDTALFGQFTHSIKDFETAASLDRSSTEERALAGFTADLTALVRASVGLGYIQRTYDRSVFRGVSGLAANATLQYFPTTLTTLSASVRRTVEDSVDFNVSGFFDTQYKYRIDHELLRNLILSAYFTHETDDYRGVSRTDEISTSGVSALYHLSRYVGLNSDLSYTDRSGHGQSFGPSFNEIRYLLSVTFQV